MELRNCEEKVNDLQTLYDLIRVEMLGKIELPVIASDAAESSTNSGIATNADESASSLDTVVKNIRQLQSTLENLAPKIDKFMKRLEERDPVSGNPRYGEKTQKRVTALVSTYSAIRKQIPSVEDNSDHPLLHLGIEYEQQQNNLKEQQALQEQEELRRKEEQEKQKQLEQQEEALRKKQREEQERREREEQEALLHQQAIDARQTRIQREQQEQEWFDSIKKGKEGVQFYLEKLKESTKTEGPGVQAAAFNSLLTIFQQINAHPEETKFRRIRRNHEQFVNDVGRHSCGVEVLIAGGFVLGAIDDVPCYLSKEPDIEKDMDGWSAWFEINKVTLELLEKAVINL